MKEDPGFAAFWAIYPRKDRKIEARYEWRRAARSFGADRVILAAADYCAAARGKPRDAIFTASAWLRGLEAPEQVKPSGIFGLDARMLGEVLRTTALISRQLGHSDARGTVRDYIAPHGPYGAERDFVNDVIRGRNPQEMISIDEITEWMRQDDWQEPGAA